MFQITIIWMHCLIIYENLQSKSLKEKERILKKIENDATRPVLFSESKGGSESQLRLLFKFDLMNILKYKFNSQ